MDYAQAGACGLFLLDFMDRGNENEDKKVGYRHTIKYLGIFGGAQGFSMLLNMLRTKITSVLLGVAGQSIIALSNRTIQMFSDLTGLSLAFSAVRRMSDAYSNGDEAVVEHCVKVVRSIAFLTGLLGTLLMLAVTPLITKHKKALKVSTFWQNVLSSFVIGVQFYLPMQKREKISPRMSWVVMVPVISPRWWRVSRTSCAMKSPDMPIFIPSMARDIDSPARVSA